MVLLFCLRQGKQNKTLKAPLVFRDGARICQGSKSSQGRGCVHKLTFYSKLQAAGKGQETWACGSAILVKMEEMEQQVWVPPGKQCSQILSVPKCPHTPGVQFLQPQLTILQICIDLQTQLQICIDFTFQGLALVAMDDTPVPSCM